MKISLFLRNLEVENNLLHENGRVSLTLNDNYVFLFRIACFLVLPLLHTSFVHSQNMHKQVQFFSITFVVSFFPLNA